MNTLESKLRIAHQIQVAAMKKELTCNIDCFYSECNGKIYPTIWVHCDTGLVESLEIDESVSEQELLDWWEAIEK